MLIYQAKSKDNLVDFLFLNSSHLCLLNRAKKKLLQFCLDQTIDCLNY